MTIYHNHHIIPKHAGGSDDLSNLVQLTVEEHAQAHLDLYEEFGLIQDLWAYKGLTGQMSKEEMRIEAVKIANTGRKRSEETKKKMRQAALNKTISRPCKKNL